jgi:predicted O-methyltransferase YrrM
MARTALELSQWQGYLTGDEVAFVHEMASMIPPDGVVVAIGAGAGTHTLAILEVTNDVVIFSVDIRCGESPELTNEHLRLKEVGYAETGHVIRIWGDSKIAGKRWPIPIDFLFVDGDHEESGIIGDIQEWVRHVKPGGVYAFHDYGATPWPAVKATVDKFSQREGWTHLQTVDHLIAFRKDGEDANPENTA